MVESDLMQRREDFNVGQIERLVEVERERAA
jgi:hypothetical protein